jgi:hypothetical protein
VILVSGAAADVGDVEVAPSGDVYESYEGPRVCSPEAEPPELVSASGDTGEVCLLHSIILNFHRVRRVDPDHGLRG